MDDTLMDRWIADREIARLTDDRDNWKHSSDQYRAEVERLQPVIDAARLHANDETPVGHLRAALAMFDKAQQSAELR